MRMATEYFKLGHDRFLPMQVKRVSNNFLKIFNYILNYFYRLEPDTFLLK
jgi:hypothetical protein